ncbi:hypothetical protein H9W90_02540 [Polaribacter pectinis]|uniref:Uncharacterized protein n=1 Tax=Polaribacter pectinis TaxID=2738844 RepID=A0A7G9LBL3_9FLAO|nr:hypothetical protein [Polaribacter pectinis]QNM86012.1 hypothetical protein H9W90_02540 [Polaribacter pectinis]
MNKTLFLIQVILFLSCNNQNKNKVPKEIISKHKIQKTETSKVTTKFKIVFDSKQVSNYKVKKSETEFIKIMFKKISEYSYSELQNLTKYRRLTLSIIVPSDISKSSLENTMKSIVYDTTKQNEDIDEIIIFAYDNKNDIDNGFTFGKLLWTQKGEQGNITPYIVWENIRDNYDFNISIKNKVGNINKTNLPTKRELEIYSEIVNENGQYNGKSEEQIRKIIMKKYKINSNNEYDSIYLKVGVYKIF